MAEIKLRASCSSTLRSIRLARAPASDVRCSSLLSPRALEVGFDSIYLFTHEKMTENLDLYSRIGDVEYDRRPIEDFHIVFMRKPLAQDAG